jgi:hypothetical protein
VLESIQAAAVRVEVEDVRIALEHMRNTVSELLVAADEDRPDLLERILAGSRRIHVIAGGDVASESESESKSPTIFSALSGVEGFEKSVVERLTAAGLLTLDQLEIARPDEIVAVSGLDAAVVGRLLAALGISRVSRSGRPVYNEPEDSLEALIHSSVAGARPSGTEPALQSEPVEDPLEAVMQSLEGGDPPAGDAVLPEDSPLGRAIRAQVDGEASVDAVRVEVQRLRAGAAALRTAVESAIVERESLNETLAQSQERLNQMLVTLAEARAVCEERRDVLGEAEVAAERAHQSIRNMRRERLVLLDAESELAATVAELRKKVNHLLRFADPDGEVEPTG